MKFCRNVPYTYCTSKNNHQKLNSKFKFVQYFVYFPKKGKPVFDLYQRIFFLSFFSIFAFKQTKTQFVSGAKNIKYKNLDSFQDNSQHFLRPCNKYRKKATFKHMRIGVLHTTIWHNIASYTFFSLKIAPPQLTSQDGYNYYFFVQCNRGKQDRSPKHLMMILKKVYFTYCTLLANRIYCR